MFLENFVIMFDDLQNCPGLVRAIFAHVDHKNASIVQMIGIAV